MASAFLSFLYLDTDFVRALIKIEPMQPMSREDFMEVVEVFEILRAWRQERGR